MIQALCATAKGILALGLMLPAAAFAQAAAVGLKDLRPNESVRVTTDHPGLVRREPALYLRTGIDTLFIQRQIVTGSWPIPLSTLKELQVQRGTSTSLATAFVGTVVGITLGAVLGGVAGVLATDLNGAPPGVLIGALAGGAIGFKLGYGPRKRWVPVILPAVAPR